MMRNADKDREIIALHATKPYTILFDIADYWLRQAVTAEQRVAELERENARLAAIADRP